MSPLLSSGPTITQPLRNASSLKTLLSTLGLPIRLTLSTTALCAGRVTDLPT